jgi:hypothetical protein
MAEREVPPEYRVCMENEIIMPEEEIYRIYNPCDFCGKAENTDWRYIRENDKINLCSKDCENSIIRFFIFNDLSFGVPYSVRKSTNITSEDIPLICMYCGSRRNVIVNPRTPRFMGGGKHHDTFCRNSTCYKNCLNYMERLRGAPKPPFYLLRNVINEGTLHIEAYLPQEGEPGYKCGL